eukprot:3121733-Pyramimonas_sp.AAC.1
MTSAMWLERELARIATLETALKNSQPVSPEAVAVAVSGVPGTHPPRRTTWDPPAATRPTANLAQELKNAQESHKKKSNKCCVIA